MRAVNGRRIICIMFQKSSEKKFAPGGFPPGALVELATRTAIVSIHAHLAGRSPLTWGNRMIVATRGHYKNAPKKSRDYFCFEGRAPLRGHGDCSDARL